MALARKKSSIQKSKNTAKSQDGRLSDLLRAAMGEFTKKGISNTTVEDITNAAGVAKGTFYLYFESKDSLVGKLWEDHIQKIVDYVSKGLESIAPGDDIRPFLYDILETMLDHSGKNATLHRIVYGGADAAALEACRKANEKAADLISEVFTKAWSNRSFSANPGILARIIYHGAHAVLNDTIMNGKKIKKEDMIGAVKALVETALPPV